MTADKKPNEIHLTRQYDAPLSAVWDAWNDPVQAAHWWGPRGFTITTHSKELKVGGMWHYTMHGPDGVNYVNKTRYLEVEHHKKLVYDHGGNDEKKPLFRVTVLFSESKGKTVMDMTMACPTAEDAVQTRGFIKKASGNSTWDRLGEYLDKASTGKERFIINRTFDVPVDTMYDLWTKPEHFVRWLPPTGFKMRFINVDVKPGGQGFYEMSAQNNSMKMYGKVNYIKFERPHLIQYTQQFADEKGNIARHPMAPTWPETMLTTVTLAEEGAGRTRVTVSWEPYGQATAEEVATFVKQKAGMTQGWTGSFDKLDELLPEFQAARA
jgi:uncharacterized protein YndB with AHSA1/START domain